MVVLQSVVITVVPLCLAHIVGGITIQLLFAMCGREEKKKNVGELMVVDYERIYGVTFLI